MEELGGRLRRGVIYVYLRLIHIVGQQKPTQHYKAIILQFFKKYIIVNYIPQTVHFRHDSFVL